MQFFKITGTITEKGWEEKYDDRREVRKFERSMARLTEDFRAELDGSGYAFVSELTDSSILIGVVVRKNRTMELIKSSIKRFTGLSVEVIDATEVTISAFEDMLRHATRQNYVQDPDEIKDAYGIGYMTDFGGRLNWADNIFAKNTKKGIFESAEKYLCKDELIPELCRIYAVPGTEKISGHPVHYMIETDDREVRNSMYRLLMQALYNNNRIESRRYTYIDFTPGQSFNTVMLDRLYQSSSGGTMVIRYLANDAEEDDEAVNDRDVIEAVCSTMKKYSNSVLTIFCLPRECTKSRDIFFESIGSCSIIEIREDRAHSEKAVEYLKMLCRENNVRADRKLYERVEKGEGYLAVELREIFDSWFNEKLRTKYYPQYKENVQVKKKAVREAPRGSAYDELMEMIGLTEAKKVIMQALNYKKAQKIFGDMGMKKESLSMHMVFTGNPGTAKTSVARLFARIMKENDLVSKGQMIEVGRGDLVGKYVGWTAPTIKKKFKDASGGVLFIDEAYSLVDDRSGSYGDEAINTIVQEMENHRSDVVVIFAGYPDKMEEFLNKNPGLRSRIAFHVPFDDYDTEELCDIARLIARKKGMTLSDGAMDRLSLIFDGARGIEDFGNGRYVRNVIERAKMAQASRLLSMNLDKVKKSDVCTILAEDIEIPERKGDSNIGVIGFRCAV